MREIKFRAWDGERIIDMDDLCFVTQGGYSSILLDILGGYLDSVTLMQYTGLKDANGVEIYEGDVVRVDVSNGPGEGEYVCEVVFAKNGFYAAHTSRWHSIMYFDFQRFGDEWRDMGASGTHEMKYTVIGNIHQSPELLEASE